MSLNQPGGHRSPLAERLRQRTLSANRKAAEAFFSRNLPPGWKYHVDEREITLTREAPVFLLPVPAEDYLVSSKATLLNRARRQGQRKICSIRFKVERHDDNVVIRQNLQAYARIRSDLLAARERLKIAQLCGKLSPELCRANAGARRGALDEFETTRTILTQKLQVTAFYRISALYLYPLKNQCITPELDWYFVNAEFPGGSALFPLEAREEIEIILRNLNDIKMWE